MSDDVKFKYVFEKLDLEMVEKVRNLSNQMQNNLRDAWHSSKTDGYKICWGAMVEVMATLFINIQRVADMTDEELVDCEKTFYFNVDRCIKIMEGKHSDS